MIKWYTYKDRTFVILFHPGDPEEKDRHYKITYSLHTPDSNTYIGEIQFTTSSDMEEIYEGAIGGIHQWVHSLTRVENELLVLGFERQ